MSAGARLRAGDRVLITRLNYLGDVVMSLPTVDAIRRTHPEIEIDYLTREPAASLLRGDGRFARVITWRDGIAVALRTVRELRSRQYRAVVDLYSNPRSAWLSWLSGAPVRIGANRRGRRWLYTHRVVSPRGLPVTDVFLRYAQSLGVEGAATKPGLSISDDERRQAETLLTDAGIPAGPAPRIGVHPGGKWPVKRWPAAHVASLVGRLQQDGARVLLFTGPGEEGATRDVLDGLAAPVPTLAPVPIRTAAAAISCLDAMVACDGGIMHTAVAVATPTVGIFGSSQPEVWFPYEQFGSYRAAWIDVPCRPCHQHVCPLGHTRCLNELAPDHVAGMVNMLLDAGARGTS